MIPHFPFSILPILSCTLLCSASVVPPRTDLRPRHAAYYDALGLPLTMRQNLDCLDRDECDEGEVCVQLVGELVCEENCDGFCLPEAALKAFCNCDNPCEEGKTCVSPDPTKPQPDNGVCRSDDVAKDGLRLECPKRDDSENTAPKPTPVVQDASEGGKSGKREPPKDGGTKSEDTESEPDNTTKPETDNSESETDNSESETDNSESEAGNNVETNPETSGDTNEGVCIGADMLDRFGAHELVFPKHVLSHALCDVFGSCATKGHMVKYAGRGMMMSSYCRIVGCTEAVIYVNSPKYRRGLRVGSRSKDMEFTSFAARFATRGEEVVLRAAMRLGL